MLGGGQHHQTYLSSLACHAMLTGGKAHHVVPGVDLFALPRPPASGRSLPFLRSKSRRLQANCILTSHLLASKQPWQPVHHEFLLEDFARTNKGRAKLQQNLMVRQGASSVTWLSGPCSACESRSAAMCSGFAEPSAMTSTSEGPAGMSMEIMASLLDSSILAAVTYWLPGPSILSTCGAAEHHGRTTRGMLLRSSIGFIRLCCMHQLRYWRFALGCQVQLPAVVLSS